MHPKLRAVAMVARVAALALLTSSAFAETRLNMDGSVTVAGERMRCDKARMRLDRRLPNLGAADMSTKVLMLNPVLLGEERPVVQRFVFYHECGHLRVGGSEIGADCWAIDRGVEEGWLDKRGIADVCRSFGNAPETPTHPSAKRRCVALDRCFVAAETRVNLSKPPPQVAVKAPAAQSPPTVKAAAKSIKETPTLTPGAPPPGAPQLLERPRLVRVGAANGL